MEAVFYCFIESKGDVKSTFWKITKIDKIANIKNFLPHDFMFLVILDEKLIIFLLGLITSGLTNQ